MFGGTTVSILRSIGDQLFDNVATGYSFTTLKHPRAIENLFLKLAVPFQARLGCLPKSVLQHSWLNSILFQTSHPLS